MPQLTVKGLPDGDNGRALVRLNHKHRDGIERYGIARMTNLANQKSLIVLVLGHDAEDAVFMPYDIRTMLDVSKGGNLNFSIRRVRFLGRLLWYINSPDPAVHIPAWIAVIGLVLAIVGVVAGIIPLICPQGG